MCPSAMPIISTTTSSTSEWRIKGGCERHQLSGSAQLPAVTNPPNWHNTAQYTLLQFNWNLSSVPPNVKATLLWCIYDTRCSGNVTVWHIDTVTQCTSVRVWHFYTVTQCASVTVWQLVSGSSSTAACLCNSIRICSTIFQSGLHKLQFHKLNSNTCAHRLSKLGWQDASRIFKSPPCLLSWLYFHRLGPAFFHSFVRHGRPDALCVLLALHSPMWVGRSFGPWWTIFI